MLCDREPFRMILLKIIDGMGCFFACFRVKDRDQSPAQLFPNEASSKSKDPFIPRNQFSSLFSFKEPSSPCKDDQKNSLQSPNTSIDGDNYDEDLKAQAKFLRSCGTLLHTPTELRKKSDKLKYLHGLDDESCKFRSPLPVTPFKELGSENKPDVISLNNSVSSEQQSENSFVAITRKQSMGNCFSSPEENGGRSDCNEVTTDIPDATIQFKKSLRFECEANNNPGVSFMSYSPVKREYNSCSVPDSQCTEVWRGQMGGVKNSPDPSNPTPLKLTLETPGTVYPANLESYACGKKARIGSQYVYSVLSPIENASRNALKKASGNFQRSRLGESVNEWRKSKCESFKTPEGSYKENMQLFPHMPLDGSLSKWLKPMLPDNKIQDQKDHFYETRKFSDNDRPILGTVAAHWNDYETLNVAKFWDGNGIPNSTNKYKEDQKVNWHATPFEERLEKALSDEKVLPKRKLVDFDENEESDTADSNSCSSLHLQSTILV